MIKFISYTGKYPKLCTGSLKLEIEGEIVSFGDDIDDDYEQFWASGGEAIDGKGGSIFVYKRPWAICEDKLPEKYKKYKDEIKEVLNGNVKWGCCGGCVY